MKITKVSYERLDLQLTVPYTIAYETISKTTNFILKVETDSPLVGYRLCSTRCYGHLGNR